MQSLTRTRSGAFRIEDAITPEEAKELSEQGRLTEKLLPADYALGHLPRADMPETYEKLIVNGAKIPLTDETEPLEAGTPVRIYLRGRFWGIAERREEQLAWKAQIAPEDGPEEMN
jgi:tRNA pseudouridine55 synthase